MTRKKLSYFSILIQHCDTNIFFFIFKFRQTCKINILMHEKVYTSFCHDCLFRYTTLIYHETILKHIIQINVAISLWRDRTYCIWWKMRLISNRFETLIPIFRSRWVWSLCSTLRICNGLKKLRNSMFFEVQHKKWHYGELNLQTCIK